jgi:hypothetical protein
MEGKLMLKSGIEVSVHSLNDVLQTNDLNFRSISFQIDRASAGNVKLKSNEKVNDEPEDEYGYTKSNVKCSRLFSMLIKSIIFQKKSKKDMAIWERHFYSKLIEVMQQLVCHLLVIVTEQKWPALLLV